MTDYLLDVQPGLAKVIATMTGANTTRFVHERGLLSQQDSNGNWQWMVADGLGSVRGVVDGTGFDPAYSVHYAPYGQPWGEQGTEQTPFGFTGEPTDDNGLVHLRARYYNPALGVFPSLDPLEGILQQAMSLNRYAYVAGNVVNAVDPSGNAPVEIWAAAFISPNEVTFPYPDGLDPNAKWHGDNRSWYNGTQALPLSSRVWWWVQFDTCAMPTTFDTQQDTGRTSVTTAPLLPWPISEVVQPVTYTDKADPPSPATYRSFRSSPTTFTHIVYIETESTNPLVATAPPIQILYDIFFDLATVTVSVYAELDRYPWHELRIAINGIEVQDVTIQREPQGPSYSAADLFFYPDEIVMSSPSLSGTPMDFHCEAYGYQPIQPTLVNIPSVVYDNFNVDCLFT